MTTTASTHAPLPASPTEAASPRAVRPVTEEAGATEADPPTTRPEPGPAVGFQLRILESIRRITRSVDLYSKHVAARHGVTLPQLVALLTVCEHGPLTVTHLGKLMHLSPSTLIGVIDRLEEKGLLRRERSGKDRRAVFLTATEKAHELSRNAPSPLQQGLANALDTLPEEEQSAIAGVLERVVAMMETQPLVAPALPLLEAARLSEEVAPEPPHAWPETSKETYS